MSKGVRFILGVLGALLLGTLGSLIATAVFDLRLPPWMMREPAPPPVEQPNLEMNWLFVWLIVLAVVIGIIMVLVYFAAQAPGEPPEPKQSEYTKDYFFNLLWRWVYGSDHILKLACFCRLCDRQCQLKELERWPFQYGVMCNMHGEQYRFQGDPETLLHDVQIEIERKLRNGEWKEVVSRNWKTSETT